ncbi:uncharacterized protein LOC107036625 [Diachasma alloeum]|uniref:uncharacterized protein LOC107036625 n=1 Tax=Diachasma alloeum TaxID=454923 RepID=UPI0007384C09|nr:uncharacterized protein LOC107036625 [Diachasma alloeum]
MKTLGVLCCLLPLAVICAVTEKELYQYAILHTNIRMYSQNVSSFLLGVDLLVQQLAEKFHRNLSSLRVDYAVERFPQFEIKYKAKAAEFAKNTDLNKDCSKYIADLLRENEVHKGQLASYAATAVQSWKDGIYQFHKAIANTRLALANGEVEAADCGALLDQDDETLAYNCALKVLTNVKKLDDETIGSIYNRTTEMDQIHDAALNNLHQSIKDRFIPEFYNTVGIDGWLADYCPS